MIDNTGLLSTLLTQGKIKVQDSEIFHKIPPQLPNSFIYEKVEGMLLGLAIGDALGAPTESMRPTDRNNDYGEIRDYLPVKRSNYRVRGVGTDDTQLSFWTLEQLVTDGGLIPEELARRFCANRIWGMGGVTRKFIENFKDKKIPWDEAGVLNALGNGALMRIAPIVLPYLRNPHPSMYADAAIDAMITHNSYANTACCVAFVKLIWALLGMTSTPETKWWMSEFCSTASKLEGDTVCQGREILLYQDYKGPLWKYAEQACKDALAKEFSVKQACQSWGSGASLFQTVPSVLYILTKHADDPEEAIIRAVNDTKDNDTIASIVGAAVGALHGLAGIPERWVRNLVGRVRKGGTGQVFRLIIHAKQIFWLQNSPWTNYSINPNPQD